MIITDWIFEEMTDNKKKRKRLDGETGRKNDKTNPNKPALRFAGLKKLHKNG